MWDQQLRCVEVFVQVALRLKPLSGRLIESRYGFINPRTVVIIVLTALKPVSTSVNVSWN